MCRFAVVVSILLSSLAQAQSVEGTLLSQVLRLRLETRIDDQADLRRLYRIMDYELLWHAGVAGDERRVDAERTLSRAADHGLEAATPVGSAGTPEATAEHDLALSRSLLLHARELRFGRVPQVGSSTAWHIEDDVVDLVESLANAIRRNDLRAFLGALAPLAPDYERLQAARRRLQEILAGGGWPVIPGDAELVIDSLDPRLPLLRARLALEGDLASGAKAPADVADALRRFQQRHGLDADGRIGPRTLAELRVGTEQRIAQIEANLERWRWLPHSIGDTHVLVNAAAATLTLARGATPVHHERVIVGDEKHQTPSFAASITGVTANPPWNVPTGIATREIFPRLRKNSGYLAANDIIIVDRLDDPFGLSIDWQRLGSRSFPFRLQQRSGPNNALGRLKFEMPNRFDVFLHDTPTKRLFARASRAFSHGCVRVERPVELASALLGDGNAPGIVESAIESGDTRFIRLPSQIPVYLVYFTAFVDDAGRTNFRRDLYGRDPPIIRALRGRAVAGPGNAGRQVGCPGPEGIAATSALG